MHGDVKLLELLVVPREELPVVLLEIRRGRRAEGPAEMIARLVERHVEAPETAQSRSLHTADASARDNDLFLFFRGGDDIFVFLQRAGIERAGDVKTSGETAEAAVVAANAGTNIVDPATADLLRPFVIGEYGPCHGDGVHSSAGDGLQRRVGVAHLAGN